MKIRKAKISDVKEVQTLINKHAKRHKMIPRSLNDLYDKLRDIFICEDEGRIVGTCSLHVSWENLAEIRSLAVEEERQGKGIGRKLVRRALKDAGTLGINTVFVLTYYPEYFNKNFKFHEIDKAKLPSKIWSDCLNCPVFPDCEETAMIVEL